MTDVDSAIETARGSLEGFIKLVMRTESGEPVELADIHQSWLDHIRYSWNRGLHAAIFGPWGHGKTIMVPVSIPLFLLGRNQNLRIKLISNSDEKAQERVRLCSQYISQSSWYRSVFPHVSPDAGSPWTGHRIFVKRSEDSVSIDPSIEARGILTTGIGGRADFLFFDDVVDPRNAIYQPTLRKKVIELFRETWMPRLEPWGLAAYVATLWHKEDLSHSFIRDPEIRNRYCVLLQRVSGDYGHIISEVFNVPDDEYPLPSDRSAVKVMKVVESGIRRTVDARATLLGERILERRY
jgi:hypothetical protein